MPRHKPKPKDEPAELNEFERSILRWIRVGIDDYIWRGMNGLHAACFHGRNDILKFLLESTHLKHQINHKDAESWTPLHRCIYNGYISCAIQLLNFGADLTVVDYDGLSPLDLINADKKCVLDVYKNKRTSLKRVTESFQTFEDDELSLDIGDVIEVQSINESGWSTGNKLLSRKTGCFPSMFLSDLDDSIQNNDLSFNEIFVWGNNSNFTLGQKDSKNRNKPEAIYNLSQAKVSVKQVCLSQFHLLILSDNGLVYSCGLGRGGRLGHGNEQTILLPQCITFGSDTFITSVASARDHSLFLDENGRAYSCGLNDLMQLGHSSSSNMVLVPTKISHSSLKSLVFTGVACARFHSVIYTDSDLYTFGFNGGQLGHSPGQKYYSTPKIVSALHGKDVKLTEVSVSDGATACLLENNEIYILSNFTCRKIQTRQGDLLNLVTNGGFVDLCDEVKSVHHLEYWKQQPLRICIMNTIGEIFTWKTTYSSLHRCYCNKKKFSDVKARHITLGQDVLMVVTASCELLKCSFSSIEPKEISRNTKSKLSQALPEYGKSNLQKTADHYKVLKEEEVELYMEQIPLVNRAVTSAVDSSGKTFAVIQSTPHSCLARQPRAGATTLSTDLLRLLHDADPYDDLHDTIVICKDGQVACHYIFLHDINGIEMLEKEKHKWEVNFKKITRKEIMQWLDGVYGTNLSSLPNNNCSLSTLGNKMKSLNVLKSQSGDDTDDDELQEKKKRLTKSAHTLKQLPRFLHWKQWSNSSDVTIVSSDGRTFNCHRCILTTRSEYFRGMLMYQWLETQDDKKPLQIDVPGHILKCVLDFLYTDEVDYSLPRESSLEFLCDLIICCDQLLLKRLLEFCEMRIASYLTMKTALQLFCFSIDYNANGLLALTSDFIALNLSYFLESRQLEQLEIEEAEYLDSVYQKLVRNMDERLKKETIDLSDYDYKDDFSYTGYIDNKKLGSDNRSPLKRRSQKSSDNSKMKNSNPLSDHVGDVLPITSNIDQHEASAVENSALIPHHDVSSLLPVEDNTLVIEENNSTNNEDNSHDVNDSRVSSSPKKSGKKKSQREKKLERKAKAEADSRPPKLSQENSPPRPVKTWAAASPASTNSFLDVMNEEKLKIECQKSITDEKKPQKKAVVRNKRTSSSENPWGDLSVKPRSESVDLEGIIANQFKEKKDSERDNKKPLDIIQIEERAIDELLKYYEEHDNFKHDYKIERITEATAQPKWQKRTSQ